VLGDHFTVAAVFVLLGSIGLVGGFLTISAAARSLAEPMDEVRRGLARVRRGDLTTELPINDAGDIGLVMAGFNDMVAGLRERAVLEDLFGRHVGADVAKAALERGVELGGELCAASVLFVDLVGSTGLTRLLEPHDVVGLLNRFFAAVVDAVTAEGGWVNKFEGDAALCVFGPPAGHPDHAPAALRAALCLRDRLLTLTAGELVRVDMGIGVATGKVVAGNLGAEQRYEYTVIGDPVNEAARLTELAKTMPGRILASGATISASQDAAGTWCLVDEVVLRGRDERTSIFGPSSDP
jgi:adenylate cyclase